MKIHFFSPIYVDHWDWRNAETIGIGGSETSHVEMAWRLARRGYDVYSYSALPKDDPTPDWRGVKWRDLKDVDFGEDGLWIFYRHAGIKKEFGTVGPDQHLWLVVQDVDCQFWAPEDTELFERIMPLCRSHYSFLLKKHPEAEGKLFISANGLKTELVREIEKKNIVRNPHRVIYTSSPDRGLVNLLPIFERAKEYVPDLELHLFYGTQGIDVSIEQQGNHAKRQFTPALKAVERAKTMKGVHWHGRVDHRQLCEEWFKSAIWCYPTTFTETSCITCMQAQAMGAVPITGSIWALADNVHDGALIHGDPSDALVKARYVDAMRRIALNPEVQDEIRESMMIRARSNFHWEAVVDQWERWVLELEGKKFPEEVRFWGHHTFVHKHMEGKTLNVGSDIDAGGFRFRDNITNLDYSKKHPYAVGTKRYVDIEADARDLPHDLDGQYDTVILEEVLEHMSENDVIETLNCAKRVLKPGGRVIITWPLESGPEGDRECRGGGVNIAPSTIEFAPGCSVHHNRLITVDYMHAILESLGFKLLVKREIDCYACYPGYGVVACS